MRVHALEAGPNVDEREHLLELINAGWTTQVIRAACALRLPELLGGGARGTAELAAAAGLHAPSLQRLLRALVTLDVCREQEDGTFGLTARGALLRDDAPQSLRAWALLVGGPIAQRSAELEQSVRTGTSHRVRHAGSNDFTHLDADRAAAALFNRAMTDITQHVGALVAGAIDFGAARRVVDVGGGSGAMLAAILARFPAARGVLFDLAHAMEAAETLLRRAGVADRCENIAGSFFDGVPPGGDHYVLKSVLHNWDDERCVLILAQCRKAMAPGAHVLVVERVLGDRAGTTAHDRSAARSDLNMLLALSGRERREQEFRALFEAADLVLEGITPTGSEFSVLHARDRGC